jgi:hypothetical protein
MIEDLVLESINNDLYDSTSDLSRELDDLKCHIKNFIDEVKHHKDNGHKQLSTEWILSYFPFMFMNGK